MQCSVVLAQVRYTLNDPSAATWSDSTHLIPALNDALRALVSVRPDASATTAVRLLSQGTQQSIPADGTRLLRIIRNAGESGLSSIGRAVRRVSMDTLDSSMPTWHGATGQSEIREYAYDDRVPREFWVYPPVATTPTIGVLLTYVKALTDITATSDTFPVDDFFAPAVEAFMLYRLLGGDDEASPNYQAAQAQFSAFQTLLGLKSGGDSAMAARRDIK